MAIETDVTAKILIVQRRQVYATLGTEKGGGLLIEARLLDQSEGVERDRRVAFFVNFALECSHICDRPYLHVRVDPRAALACSFDQRRCDSDRLPIAAQTHRCREEYRSDCQADPQARAAQETTRHEMCHRVGWEHIW